MRIYQFLARALPGLRFTSTVLFMSGLLAVIPLIAVAAVLTVDPTPPSAALLWTVIAATVVAIIGLRLLLTGVLAPIRVATDQLSAYLGDRRTPEVVKVGRDDVGSLFSEISLACTRMEQQRRALDDGDAPDSLTGLKDWQRERDHFNAVFPSHAERRRPLSISVVDIDGLRALNLAAGTAVGDAELQRVATTLQRTLRTGDWLGRWGGDEFLVACQANAQLMQQLMTRTRRALATDATNRHNLTVSVGIAEIGGDETIEACLDRAERALIEAKRHGPNQLHCDETNQPG